MKTVGKQLQDARLAREWSPELAARETKIKAERLLDLEADDYTSFSSPTYARGFVRTYARALGLDEYKILRQLDNKLPEDDNASFSNDTGVPYMPESSQVSNPYKMSTGVYVAMGVGATVLLLIAFILVQSYRVGYFAKAIPATIPTVTNAAPIVVDAEPVARALPADSNAAPVALPVDTSTAPTAAAATDTNQAPVAVAVATGATTNTVPATADATTNAVPTAAVASEASLPPTTPLDTKTPPRALPVDLSAVTSEAPAAPVPPTNAPAAVAPATVSTSAPIPAPVSKRPPSLSARGANTRPDPPQEVHSTARQTSAPATESVPVTSPTTSVDASPVPVASTAPADATSSPSPLTGEPAAASASENTGAPAVSSDSSPSVPTSTSSERAAGKRLVLTASRDSYIRVVSLDEGEKVRYSSVLHEGQSISFNDRKYSINVGVPSAVDIALDGINYGPHSDHAEPDTFTVESHQP